MTGPRHVDGTATPVGADPVTSGCSASEVNGLVARWLMDAAGFRRVEALGQAAMLEKAASELRAVCRAEEGRLLTIAEASQATGYSADHLRRLVNQGKLDNLGGRGIIRVRARDLPRKPTLASTASITQLHCTSRQQVVRSYLKKED